MKLMLVGAGGHAKAICEAVKANGDEIIAYVDVNPALWLEAPHIESDEAALAESRADGVVIGVGGIRVEQLVRRLALLDRYRENAFEAPPVIHPRAAVSETAELDAGAIVLAGAVVQPGAVLRRGALVNSGAIVEHDSEVGAGAHIAPGAAVLGACRVGACAMIGAGAVVLPGATVPERHLVKAATVFSGANR